jgi:hypothetical protein
VVESLLQECSMHQATLCVQATPQKGLAWKATSHEVGSVD